MVDLTLEGLMHARETPAILAAGARILHISNEHPEALERLRPDPALEQEVRTAARMLRGAQRMHVTSAAGHRSDDRSARRPRRSAFGAGRTKPGTLAHWPGGLVLAFRLPARWMACWCWTAAT